MSDIKIELSRIPEGLSTNIFLIGYMGTGKTTTAKIMSEILGLPLIDLDREIENHYDKPVTKIFEENGEDEFRAMEAWLLYKSILDNAGKSIQTGTIFSCGGGTPLYTLNTMLMHYTGRVVLLTADAETIMDRLNGSSDRPLFTGKTLDEIREMIEIREPFYFGAADIIIDTNEKTPEDVAGEIIMELDLIPPVS